MVVKSMEDFFGGPSWNVHAHFPFGLTRFHSNFQILLYFILLLLLLFKCHLQIKFPKILVPKFNF